MDTLNEALRVARLRRDLPVTETRRRLREKAGVSQQALAASVGVTSASISRWESGERTPRGVRLIRYVSALRRFARETE